jgi:NAD/NADP transhydrogenase alpha subunit
MRDRYTLSDSFNLAQKVGFLQRIGYEVINKEQTRHRSVYHNDIESYTVHYLEVSKDGVAVGFYREYANEELVNKVFEKELTARLLDVLVRHNRPIQSLIDLDL